MANTYNWKINSLACVPSLNGHTNVVSVVHWSINANDGQEIMIANPSGGTSTVFKNIASSYGAQELTLNDQSTFVDYSALTKDVVVGWVQEAMGLDAVTRLQESLDKQLETLNNPPVVTPPLPWSTEQ